MASFNPPYFTDFYFSFVFLVDVFLNFIVRHLFIFLYFECSLWNDDSFVVDLFLLILLVVIDVFHYDFCSFLIICRLSSFITVLNFLVICDFFLYFFKNLFDSQWCQVLVMKSFDVWFVITLEMLYEYNLLFLLFL